MNKQLTTGEAAVADALERVATCVANAQEAHAAEDLTLVLRRAADLERLAAELVASAVYVARERSNSWRAIGEELGTSKGAAWQRFKT